MARRLPWVTYLLIVANVVVFWSDGWLYLLATMLFLLVFGAKVEGRFGRVRFLVFYLLCGCLAAYAYGLLHGTGPQVAASGAISGVLGSYLVLFPRARARSLAFGLPSRLPAWLALGLWFVVVWFFAEAAYAALGFAFGVFATLPLLKRRPPFAYQYPR